MSYWFKRRRYGWGWTPVTWQGWSVLGVFLVYAIGTSVLLSLTTTLTDLQFIFTYLTLLSLGLAVMLWLTMKHSPKGKWRWGWLETDNPEEDF